MTFQSILTLLIVLAGLLYLARSVTRSATKGGCASGCGSCGKAGGCAARRVQGRETGKKPA